MSTIQVDMVQPWKKAEDDFVASFNKHGKRAYVHRFSDTAEAVATNGKGTVVRAQPSDFFITLDGVMFFAEVKSTVDDHCFHFSNIRQGQMNACRRTVAAGGTYLFYIRSWARDCWYIVPGQLVVATNKVRKHLTWDELEPFKHHAL